MICQMGIPQVKEMEKLIKMYPDSTNCDRTFRYGYNKTDGKSRLPLPGTKNVYVESGGITWLFHKEFYPYPLCDSGDQNGDRDMWYREIDVGSDYPRTMTAITYDMSKDFIEKTSALSEEEKKQDLRRKCERLFYGFPDLDVPEKIRNMVE